MHQQRPMNGAGEWMNKIKAQCQILWMDELDWKYICSPFFLHFLKYGGNDCPVRQVFSLTKFGFSAAHSVPRANTVFFELSKYIGTMSSKWLCFRGQDGGGPAVLAGKQLSTVYWAMNLLAINRLLQYSTILCCYLTRLGCTRIDFVWFWDFVPRSTLSNIWSVQCPRCVNKICQ